MTDKTSEFTGEIADDSNSSVSDFHDDGSLSGLDRGNGADPADDDGCFCIICADHPRFENDEAYFEHYRNFHDKEKQAVDDSDKNQESKDEGESVFRNILRISLNFMYAMMTIFLTSLIH